MKNGVWSSLGFLVPSVISFVSIPLYIYYLGTVQFGIWTLLNSILGMAGLFSLGISEATTKYIAELDKVENQEERNEIIYVATIISLFLGVLATIFIIGISGWILNNALGIKEPDDLISYTSLFKEISYGLLPSVSSFSILGILNGFQDYKNSQKTLIIRNILLTISSVLLLFFGLGIDSLVRAVVIIYYLIWFYLLYLTYNKLSSKKISTLNLFRNAKKLLGYGLYASITTLGTMSLTHLDRFLVGALINLEAVTIYSVSRNLSSYFHTINGAASKVLMPFFSKQKGSFDSSKLTNVFVDGWTISIMIDIFIMTLALSTSNWLLEVWVGREIAEQAKSLYVIFIFVFLVHGLTVVPHYYLMAIGRPDVVGIITLTAGISFLFIMYLFGSTYGLIGIAYSSFIYPLISFLLIVYVQKSLKCKIVFFDIVLEMICPIIYATFVCLLSIIVGKFVTHMGLSASLSLLASLVTSAVLLSVSILMPINIINKHTQMFSRVSSLAKNHLRS